MAVDVNLRGDLFRPGHPRATATATATPGAGALPGFPRLVRPARLGTTVTGRTAPATRPLARLEDIRRRRRLRRLRQVGNAALWVAGSGALTTLALGGLFSLR